MPETKSIKPSWATPDLVLMVTESMQKIESVRAADRALVDALANGQRPYTPDEEKTYSIQVNVNWLEFTRKLQSAIGQINGAFIPAGQFFTCYSESGNITKKDKYGQDFTKEINAILKPPTKSGKRHHFILRSRNACVALHGIGPLMWTNSYRLLPRFVPLEDLLIPTDTLLDFAVNLTHFAVNLYLTPGELYRMACTDKRDPGWNQEVVIDILKDMKDDKNVPFFNQSVTEWRDRPEAIQELWKQNRGFLESDAAPKAKLRAFYFQNPEDSKWYRKIILRDNTPSVESRKKFIYDSDKPFADDIDHILQCQFGDNSLVAPLKYHSVRGLGTMEYGPSFTLNRVRCQTVQHALQNLLTFWRVSDPVDRDRLKAILLLQHGIMPEGASIVPNDERHQIDPRLIQFVMSQLKQNIAENSTSYSPESDSGTQKERTKFEVQTQLQMSSAAVGNVLSMMYAQEIFYYSELVRRALLENTDDPTAKAFQKACKKHGIPDELMKHSNWRIVPERVLGAGDNMLGQAQADALMSQKASFEPDAQRKIQRLWTSQTLKDPDRALELVPEQQDDSTSGTRTAEALYPGLMRGIAIPMRAGIDHAGYAATLLEMMGVEIEAILQQDGMGTPADLKGFVTVSGAVEQVLKFLAQNEENKSLVKELNDKLSELMNHVKAFAQRLEEAAQAKQPSDPEAEAKAASIIQLTEAKLQSSEATVTQKLQHKEASFQQKQQQSATKHQQDQIAKGAALGSELAAKSAQTNAEMIALGQKTAAEVASKGMQVGADIEATKLKSAAQSKSTPPKE